MPFKMETLEASDNGASIISIRFTGKLTRDDYELFVPELERLLDKPGRLRLLMALIDFKGWSPAALWEDAKLGVRQFKNLDKVDKIAVVGDRTWEEKASTLAKPFVKADLRYFDASELDQARQWVMAGGEAA